MVALTSVRSRPVMRAPLSNMAVCVAVVGKEVRKRPPRADSTPFVQSMSSSETSSDFRSKLQLPLRRLKANEFDSCDVYRRQHHLLMTDINKVFKNGR